MEPDLKALGLKVGLEVHQQLATDRKLFCRCSPDESGEQTERFFRTFRLSKSEMGEYDPAAVFERTKSRTISYAGSRRGSCLVEEDEEPPHDLDSAAKGTALLIASALGSHIFREIFVMRKIVIDGSNTSGFQRTMLISQGGAVEVDDRSVGVQSVCLEEDAARLVADQDGAREYDLDRLGMPLVEIALEPVEAGPEEVRSVALALGRMLRATRRVARGIGTIRQDINISVRGGGVVEVKGVQQLDQLEKVVAFEAKRQDGLLKIARMVQDRGAATGGDAFDVADLMRGCGSKVIQTSLKTGSAIRALRVCGFAGLFGYEPYPGVRIGKELAQLVRSLGVGGIFHSDELPGYGIVESDIGAIRERLRISGDDGFLIVAADPSRIDFVVSSILDRLRQVRRGVPAETRQAFQDGETVFLRPRPGASRMYPETDIAPVSVSPEELEEARRSVPRAWHEELADLQKRYRLNPQLAEQIMDSPYLELFEEVTERSLAPPNFTASILCSTVTNLQRRGLETELSKSQILETFELLSSGAIPKESVEMIFESIMSSESATVGEAVKRAEIGNVGEEELEGLLSRIVEENRDMIAKRGERALGALMGKAMGELRGKASGERVSEKLRSMVRLAAEEKSG